MKNLIIIGASGFGREVAWLVERINKVNPTWNLMGFIDDAPEMQGKFVNGYAVLGTTEDVSKFDAHYVCAIGSAKVRELIINRISEKKKDIQFATLIDPSVEMSEFISIGEGTIICAHCILTVNIEVGRYTIINLDCTIGHDTILQDFVTLYPNVNVSGKTNIGHCCEIGTGVQIIQERTIGKYSLVGAGSVIVKDIPDKCTAVGSPAKPIKYFE